MTITHILIQKFLENRCTPAEAEAVARHLKKHPELMAIYLKSSWDAADAANDIPPGYTEEMRNAINGEIGKHTRVIRFRWLAVAASLLVSATALWLFFPGTKKSSQPLATTEKQTVAPASWKTGVNTYTKVITIKLEDGSVVKLAPKASIKYLEPFGQQKQRNIYMKGEADFEVAHDSTKPFTVHTKLFSTTALGTSFRVSETETTCNVKLFHGKVLVKSLVSTLKGWKQDVILLPGHEMKYNLKEGAVAVVPFKSVVKQPNESVLVFNNTALPDVMKTLTAKYHYPIFYDEELLKGKYFSGEVRKRDSLSVLLTVIANMNGLQVIKKEEAYIITQSK